MRLARYRLWSLWGLLIAGCFPLQAEEIMVAAASSLKPAMTALVADFRQQQPGADITLVYGSSGRLFSQIQRGAPYHLYFAADMDYPRQLAAKGFAGSEVWAYGEGRLALWSQRRDATQLTLEALAAPEIRRLAIAKPQHAPYGQRAEEALRTAGVWEAIEPKLVYGESIAHVAQFAQTGNVEVAILALTLALSPPLASHPHQPVPAQLHTPLPQGFMLTQQGRDNVLAQTFAEYVRSQRARRILAHHGLMPVEAANE